MANILCPYLYVGFPPRATTVDHLYCFQRYSEHCCHYVNLGIRRLPRNLANWPVDVILFDLTMLSPRWAGREAFGKVREKVRPLRDIPAVKILLPQDEFIQSDLLCEFVEEMNCSAIFSVLPERCWSELYGALDRSKVTVYPALTGYLDDRRLKSIEHERRRLAGGRTTDIVYRAAGELFWLGKFGMLKQRIGHRTKELAAGLGLTVDIDHPHRYALRGNQWYRFLLRGKYTIGVEGGSSLWDRDGRIKGCVEQYLREHPEAAFEEVADRCFPRDDNHRLVALSPRHLEACATRTCQILVEGDYSGILKPWMHYIPVREDLSDLGAALELAREDRMRDELTTRCHDEVVLSGLYSYQRFVDQVLSVAFGGGPGRPGTRRDRWRAAVSKFRDCLSWAMVGVIVTGGKLVLWLSERLLPSRLSGRIRRRLRGRG